MSTPIQADSARAAVARPEVNFVGGAISVYRFSLPMTLWTKRTLFMTLLGLFLPLTAAVFLLVKAIPQAEIRTPGYIFYSNAFQFVHYYILLLSLFYGIAVVAEELEQKTLTYLFTRPISKPAILLGKMAAAWTIGALIIGPILVVTYTLFTLVDGLVYSGGAGSFVVNFPTLLQDVALALMALAVYIAIFACFGARFNRPVMWGIGFAFGWEVWVAFIPGLTRKLTVMHYIQSLTSHATGKNVVISLLGQTTPPLQSILSLMIYMALFIGLAVWTFSSKEYIFDRSKQ